MDKVFSVLRFLRVTDEHDRLSLTNLALAGSLVSMLLRPEVAVADIAAFAASVVGYSVKRFAAGGGTAEQDTEALAKAVASLETKVSGLQLGQQLKR